MSSMKRPATSPELVMVTDTSSPLAVESSFRELDDAFLQSQAKVWLGEMLHVRFSEETPTADLIADGELLFQISKEIWKKLLSKYPDLHSEVYIHERTSFGKCEGVYTPYPKVDSFLKVCKILGLDGIDMFSPSDVVEKRNIRKVCMCIRSLSKKARLKNLNVPDFDIVTHTIAMPTVMVGGIRRNIESQCSSSSSFECSPCFANMREAGKQRSSSARFVRDHDVHSDSDEAESPYKGMQLHSPPENIYFREPKDSVGEISPEKYHQNDDNEDDVRITESSSMEDNDNRKDCIPRNSDFNELKNIEFGENEFVASSDHAEIDNWDKVDHENARAEPVSVSEESLSNDRQNFEEIHGFEDTNQYSSDSSSSKKIASANKCGAFQDLNLCSGSAEDLASGMDEKVMDIKYYPRDCDEKAGNPSKRENELHLFPDKEDDFLQERNAMSCSVFPTDNSLQNDEVNVSVNHEKVTDNVGEKTKIYDAKEVDKTIGDMKIEELEDHSDEKSSHDSDIAQQNIMEMQHRVPGEDGNNTEHSKADDTDKKKQKNDAKKSRRKKKVVGSVAGGVTLIGSLLILLHLRQRKW